MTVNVMEERVVEGCYHGTIQDEQPDLEFYQTASFMAGILGVRSQLQHFTGLMKQAASGTEGKTQQCQRLVPVPEGSFCYYTPSVRSNNTT